MIPRKTQENAGAIADEIVESGDCASVTKHKESSTERFERLLAFDRSVHSNFIGSKSGAPIIIGVDEVGRGCLAGPVVACAVVLPPIEPGSELFDNLCPLNDSKLVPPKTREKLRDQLLSVSRHAIGEASVEEIDEINILQASLLAMGRAVRNLEIVSPAVILIDGNKTIKSHRDTKQVTVIGGDGKSASIAAASVIAKVHRDAFMRELAGQFPEYKWDANKGYRSPDHYAALTRLGMSIWHRRSFNCRG